MADSKPRTYSQDDAGAILRRALERQHGPGDLTHDELVATAKEIGISAEELERAAAEERSQRDVAVARDQWRRSRRMGFVSHFASFVLTIAALLGLNALTGGPWWALIVALSWAIGLGMHGLTALPHDEHKFQRYLQRQDRRRAREAEKKRKAEARNALRDGGRALGHAVQKGVGEILSAVAGEIERSVAGRPRKGAGDAPTHGDGAKRDGVTDEGDVRVGRDVRVDPAATSDARERSDEGVERDAVEQERRAAERDRRVR